MGVAQVERWHLHVSRGRNTDGPRVGCWMRRRHDGRRLVGVVVANVLMSLRIFEGCEGRRLAVIAGPSLRSSSRRRRRRRRRRLLMVHVWRIRIGIGLGRIAMRRRVSHVRAHRRRMMIGRGSRRGMSVLMMSTRRRGGHGIEAHARRRSCAREGCNVNLGTLLIARWGCVFVAAVTRSR